SATYSARSTRPWPRSATRCIWSCAGACWCCDPPGLRASESASVALRLRALLVAGKPHEKNRGTRDNSVKQRDRSLTGTDPQTQQRGDPHHCEDDPRRPATTAHSDGQRDHDSVQNHDDDPGDRENGGGLILERVNPRKLCET